VYSATGADVRTTIVDGTPVVHDFGLVRLDREAVLADAREAAAALARRAGVV
jgi:5-methylthioadenosine/S-adenosylhomocysteine deaminase